MGELGVPKILLSYNRLTDAVDEYDIVKTQLTGWQERIQTVDAQTAIENFGLYQTTISEKNRVYLSTDFSRLVEKSGVMYDNLVWTQEWARGLLNRVDDFANVLESGEDALPTSDYMACALGSTEELYFDDASCPTESYFSGSIQDNSDTVYDDSDNELTDLKNIEGYIGDLSSISVNISSESEHITTCADKQKRVRKVFDSLKVYGTGVQVLNDHVRINFSKYPYQYVFRNHNRSFNYDGDQADSTGYVYIVQLKRLGFTDEDIAKVRSTSHMTPAEFYGRWTNLESDEDRAFCMSIINGCYEDAFDTSLYEVDISDSALDFAAAYHAGMIQVDEKGNFIGNMDEFMKMNNAMLNGYGTTDKNPYLRKMAAIAMVETNDAAITAASYYGSDVYPVLYENYAKWQAITALYTMEDNETTLNLGNIIASTFNAEQGYLDAYDVSNMKYEYDAETGTGKFTFHWDYGHDSIYSDADPGLHGTEVTISIYETQGDIQSNNGGNVEITRALEKAQKDREKAAIKLVKDATVGLASACNPLAGIAADVAFNIIQDEGDYSSANSINDYVSALKKAGYDGNVKDMAGYITGQVADARGLSSEAKGYCVGAVKTTIAVAADIYAIYDLENQIEKDLAKAQNEAKMDWFGSAFGYSVSDSGNRDYFFYMDDVVNPTVAVHLEVAQNDGLNRSLGWTRNETNQVYNAINELEGVSDEQKARLRGYLNLDYSSSSQYQGYDYLNLDSNELFEQGYGTFDNDMKRLNAICQDIFGDDYEISEALRR